MEIACEQRRIRANGITFNAALAGPEDGPLVVLLHGFPEFWYGWRHQIGALARAGFRVVAPDQRGYGRSEKPRGLRAYAIDRLAADVVGLIAALGRDRAAIVGHDWGAAVAWWVATRHPSWVERLGIINGPHPAIMGPFLARHPRQLLRSWYILFFQLPRLPEASARAGDWRGLARALRASGRPGTFTDADLDRYRAAWSRPGAYPAMLAWYRAAVRYPVPPAAPRVTPPALILWGRRDAFLEPALAELSLGLCANGRLVMLDEASHWVQHEEPARVNAELLTFLPAPPPLPPAVRGYGQVPESAFGLRR